MKIVCIGGGPAGLYFSILMKKADPRHDITVVERNRPDDTFGWGVVFSDATLAGFAAGRSRQPRRDPAQLPPLGRHRRLLQGHEDHLGRSRLLRHRPQEAAQHPAGTRRGAGRRAGLRDRGRGPRRVRGRRPDRRRRRRQQLIRRKYAEHFKPDIDVRKCRYIWLGSHQKLDAFTFAFEETRVGLVQPARLSLRRRHQHLHRRDPRGDVARGRDSTSMDQDASIAFCEHVFAK